MSQRLVLRSTSPPPPSTPSITFLVFVECLCIASPAQFYQSADRPALPGSPRLATRCTDDFWRAEYWLRITLAGQGRTRTVSWGEGKGL